jgi:hypothetical protein
MNPETAISASNNRGICKPHSRPCKTFPESQAISIASVGNGVTVAQQTLTLFV